MKKSAIKVVILAGSTMLLAACNNGGGGGEAKAVTLETQSDALRELGLSIGGNGALSQYINFPSGAALRSKQLSGAPVAAKAVDPANCNTVKGTDSYQDGVKDRDFKLLSPAVAGVRVEFSGETKDKYQEQICSEDNSSVIFTQASGATENGSGETEAGLYTYFTAGSGDQAAFSLMEEYEEGELTRREFTEYLGTVEQFESEDGMSYGLNLRLKSEYFQQGGQDAKVSIGMGDGKAPLRAMVTSNSFTLEGSYSYSTNYSACQGGTLQVSTPSEGGISVSEGNLTGGELRLSSGGSTARFTFNSDGTATLVINGGTPTDLTAEEVRNARQNVSSTCTGEEDDT